MNLADRIARLQEQLGPVPLAPDPEETRRQAERDLEEIRQLGLVDRAHDEFVSRSPGVMMREWRIGYFITRETVWCDARYLLPGSDEVLQKEYGFKKLPDGQWELIWDQPMLLEEKR